MTDPAGDPRPEEVRTELERVARRWRELPLDRALAHVPAVRALVDDLAHATAGTTPPDLGPAALLDQLMVTAYDACAAGTPDVAPRVAALRRTLT